MEIRYKIVLTDRGSLYLKMQLYDATNLIKNAFQAPLAEKWADLGCGTGIFTRALSGLLPEGSSIIAIDREPQTFHPPEIIFKKADFISDELDCPASMEY